MLKKYCFENLNLLHCGTWRQTTYIICRPEQRERLNINTNCLKAEQQTHKSYEKWVAEIGRLSHGVKLQALKLQEEAEFIPPHDRSMYAARSLFCDVEVNLESFT